MCQTCCFPDGPGKETATQLSIILEVDVQKRTAITMGNSEAQLF